MGNFIAIGPDDTLYISNNQSKFCAEFNIPRCEVWYCECDNGVSMSKSCGY